MFEVLLRKVADPGKLGNRQGLAQAWGWGGGVTGECLRRADKENPKENSSGTTCIECPVLQNV